MSPPQRSRNTSMTMAIEYTIAIGGGSGYKTRGIPHSWLVSPSGKVTWHGHPASLTDDMITEELRHVRLKPVFKLPKKLKSAQRYLNSGKYAYGIKVLERYIQKAKDKEENGKTRVRDKVLKAAKSALKKVNVYGRNRLKTANGLAKHGEYLEALDILARLKKSFKGTSVGDKANKRQSTWKKDKKVKLELKGAKIIAKAEHAARRGMYKQALAYVRYVAKSSKYDGTKCQEKAEKLVRKYRRAS